jgi:radical SAM family uncharacterized protein
LNSKLDAIISKATKPTRYIGNEWNVVKKNKHEVDIRFVFAFPDIYEVGMSHLGIKILYHLLNERDDVYAERVFSPWIDFEAVMRENSIPLFSLETRDPLKEFDIIGFTLQYEMSFSNILNMLDLAGIPVLSEDRGEEYPLVIAGGPCAFNPEPLADFIDLFVIGEAEEVINEVVDLYKEWKASGKRNKATFLMNAAQIPGVYVPSFYCVTYDEEGKVAEVSPKIAGVPQKITKRIIRDFDKAYYPTKMIVPFMDVVHDRAVLEIFRGCTRGCRFCQAGMIYRPVREKSVNRLCTLANDMVASTGFDEISLASLSTSDYPFLEELVEKLTDNFREQGVSLSLPSLRIDSFSLKLAEQVQKVRKSGLTFAPEAGTQRLRDVINKGVTAEDLMSSLTGAFEMGWKTVKLYFMIGLPTEDYNDIQGIADLAYQAVRLYQDVTKNKKGLIITVSTSSFVPKAFTPFQWEGQDTIEELKDKQRFLKDKLKNKAIRYNWHEPEVSFLEAVFARGDRKVGKALLAAHKLGCKFDGWSEVFDFSSWIKAFDLAGIDPGFYANRHRNSDEIFPWDHIDAGVDKTYLLREYQNAMESRITEDCRYGRCTACGASSLKGGRYCAY